MVAIYRRAWITAALATGFVMGGCGLPGAPQPPSLNLPQRVANLTAERAGVQVSLEWTMPSRNTDKTLIEGDVNVRICRREESASTCTAAGTLRLAPGKAGSFLETLPPSPASGPPRALTYFVELDNNEGRSAGLSNGAVVLAGQAPPDISGLSVKMANNGVILRWNVIPPAQEAGPVVIRLQRTVLTSAPAKQANGETNGLLAPPPEPAVQNLLVASGNQPGVALDKDIRFGETYEYRAQRVQTEHIDGRALELPGALSPAVRIHAVNAFPPAVPSGLVAVATPAHGGIPPSIDLSWQPDAAIGVAGYIVYRRRDAGQQWQRISPAQPVIGPAFHDANVAPGQAYSYAISAVGSDGLESARSAEAQETVPNE